MRMHDEVGVLYTDALFASLFAVRGQPAESPWRLALVTIRALNRLECVGETLRHALNTLALVAPTRLRIRVDPAWIERYASRFDGYRLPRGERERQALAATLGTDGCHLLTAVYAPTAPGWLREIPAVQILRQIWVQQFVVCEGSLRQRTAEELPPAAQRITSPYDPDARFSQKRDTVWCGYKVHLTETCDAERPHLITQVATTPATTQDTEVLTSIHQALADKDLLPQTHLVDMGYTGAELLVSSQRDYGVEVLGPVRSRLGPGGLSGQARSPPAQANIAGLVLVGLLFQSKGSIAALYGLTNNVWSPYLINNHQNGTGLSGLDFMLQQGVGYLLNPDRKVDFTIIRGGIAGRRCHAGMGGRPTSRCHRCHRLPSAYGRRAVQVVARDQHGAPMQAARIARYDPGCCAGVHHAAARRGRGRSFAPRAAVA
jgi:hypothetical protein